MNRKAISDRLRELAQDDKSRSKAARLWEVLDDVETALSAGVSIPKVVEELEKHGLVMSVAVFKTTLQRMRAKRKKGLPTPYPAPVPTVTTTPVSEDRQHIERKAETQEANEGDGTGSHNPADIDRIIQSTPNLEALARIGKRKK